MPIPADNHAPGDTGHVTDHNSIADVLTTLTTATAGETTRAVAAEGSLMSRLTQAAAQTANYTATANQVVPVNTTSGNITVTLPTAPPAGTIVAVKMVIQGGTNTVTVTCGGSDALNKTGGGTSMTLTLLNQGVLLAYSAGIWVNLADDLPLSQTDLRYLGLAGGTMTGAIAMGGSKVTGLANGTVSTDAAAFGQIPAALPPSGAAGGALSGTYPNPGLANVPIAGGGTGQTTATAALSALGGAAVAGDIGGTSAAPQAVSTHLTVATNATATGTVNLDPTSTRVFAVTETGNTTFTFTSGSSYASGTAYSFTLYLSQDATGGRTTTWPGSVTWVGGIVPTLITTTGALNVLVFETVNAGTTWYGSMVTAPAFPLTVANGGTGLATLGAYQILAGGTTGTGTVQAVSGTGTSGYVLTSNGASALPTWQVAAGGGGGSGTNAGIFGDGTDTTATLDGTATVTWASKASSVYTMTRDAMLTSLTVNSGVTLNTANYRIFCTGTVANAGTIASTGNNAASSAAAAAQATGSLIGNGGGAGATGAGATGGASGTRWGTGTGSAGGLGSGGAAGAGGGAQKTGITPHRTPTAVLSGYSAWAGTGYPVSGAAGGGGGGGDGTNSGGGGGAGGGILAILAHTITNTGTLAANGGNGFTPTTGNCGGGGGGGGGIILGYSLAAWTAGTTSVTGGTQGSGVGTGAAGTAGTTGTVLNVVIT